MGHVLTEVKDGIGWITLNRPEQLNTLSREMKDLLFEATANYEHDPSVRCLVIRGNGRHFMAGGNIKEFHEALGASDRAAYFRGFEARVVAAHQVIYHLRRMPKPVLASIHGAVAGFGLSLMMASDLAIAADDAIFTLAYRHIGLSADGGASYFLPRIVGERRALEIALLGERFDAARARAFGLLNWVVPREQLAAETENVARRLADGPTLALGRAKQLIRASLDHSWDEQSHREAESIAEMIRTEDHQEGVTAFLEKRHPRFRGR
ncbi:MAG: enoyl-CoA hydratase [Alphaproteobacteria bacterium]|nr:enoyl-CoA hydratase [Alphaproteobacteria bacterium]